MVRLAHARAGPLLGYAHGVFSSRAAVRRLHLLDFDALAADRQLLTYDQRGHGHSTGRPIADDYRFENFTPDLLTLLDELDLDEPIDFMGSSLGRDVALRAAITAPERFRRLVLIIPPVAWEEGPNQARQWYTDNADVIRPHARHLGRAARPDPARHRRVRPPGA